ncbi:MAG: hypothetical protein U0229_03805 [Anaeromyxobacter sp.]
MSRRARPERSIPAPGPPQGQTEQASTARPGELAFALAGAAAVLLVVGVGASRHELWRDEMDAWLAARDAPSPLALLHAIRYGGHPVSWYLLLWPLTRWPGAPWAMQALSVALAGASAFVVLRLAPGPRWLRLLCVLGYFPVYEYGVLARNYALSVLGLAALAWATTRRRERPLTLGAVAAAAAFTTPHGLFLVVAVLAVLGGELALRPPPAAARGRAWAGLALGAAGAIVTALSIRTPPDGAYAGGWALGWDGGRAEFMLATVVRAWLPLPEPGLWFWSTNAVASALSPGALAALGAALLAGALVALRRAPAAAALLVVGAGGLLAFGQLRFVGYLRHWGFLWLCLCFAAWMAGASPVRPGRLARAAFALLAAVHVAAAGVALREDLRLRFSAAGATAELIRRAGAADLPLVGVVDFTAMNVVGHLGAARAWYPHGRRWGSHILFDEARNHDVADAWGEAAAFVARHGGPAVVVLDVLTVRAQPPPPALAPRLRKLGCERSDVVGDESYCVWVLRPEPPRATP